MRFGLYARPQMRRRGSFFEAWFHIFVCYVAFEMAGVRSGSEYGTTEMQI